MNVLYNIFVYVIWFLATYYVVLFLLVIFLEKDALYEKKKSHSNKKPFVSIIVPAYNEEKKIAFTINSLKKIKYKKVEFVIVNDGSMDATSSFVNKAIKSDKRFVFIDNKVNKGKAVSLNLGINTAKGEFVACMDADSVVQEDILEKTLPYFEDPKVGAVTVTVELKNTESFLHKIIDLEFLIGLSLFLKALSKFNCIFVTPGPFSIYRKSLLKKIGGFDPNNITEDLEIAYRIHKSHYKIENCIGAKVYTIAPSTFKGIYIQRRRWYSGAIKTIIQHKDMLFNKKYGFFGFLIPYSYLLILGGLVLFLTSLYLTASRLIQNIMYFQYTNFNILQRLADLHFDILELSGVNFVGISAFLFTMALLFIGLYFSKKNMWIKRFGILGFPLLFFLYQLFWFSSIITVLRGKRVKWR